MSTSGGYPVTGSEEPGSHDKLTDKPLSLVENALNELGLADKMPKLAALGVKHPSDVLVLREKDLGSAGLSLVEIRKLQVMCDEERDEDEFGDGATESQELHDFGKKSSIRRHSLGCMVPSLERSVSQSKRRASKFWQQQMNRPKRVVFIRHGESEANVDRFITRHVADHALHLTEEGRRQALDAGVRLKELVGDETIKFIVSPYVRTQETLNGIKQAWGNEKDQLKSRIDVRIREQEFGNYDSPDMKELHKQKKQFGQFYFRFPDGESPADCFERASSFFETMYRDWEDNIYENHVIVGHGMMILMLLMRLFRYTPERWANLDGLKNCEFVVLERPGDDGKYHIAFTWVGGKEKDYDGLRIKGEEEPLNIWTGDPDRPVLKAKKTRDIS